MTDLTPEQIEALADEAERGYDPAKIGPTRSVPAAAFAALEAIEAGEWDRFLVRLQAAIRARRQTDEYERHIVVGDR